MMRIFFFYFEHLLGVEKSAEEKTQNVNLVQKEGEGRPQSLY